MQTTHKPLKITNRTSKLNYRALIKKSLRRAPANTPRMLSMRSPKATHETSSHISLLSQRPTEQPRPPTRSTQSPFSSHPSPPRRTTQFKMMCTGRMGLVSSYQRGMIKCFVPQNLGETAKGRIRAWGGCSSRLLSTGAMAPHWTISPHSSTHMKQTSRRQWIHDITIPTCLSHRGVRLQLRSFTLRARR